MSNVKNIFISHHGKDDEHVQRLKQRLKDEGYEVRNSSVDSTKHQEKRPSDETIKKDLRDGIGWAGTFICLVGEDTHTRDWVDFEIEQAYKQGKPIVGVYMHGCSESVELPEKLEKYRSYIIGWNSLDKLGDILDGKSVPAENPDGTTKNPSYTVVRVTCN
ncbi:TIR domain-containing protein [Morganella morganii]|uniref:TIR domain-containing protein n=1 Tax=Morganella morganii TaxID=582 RepID=UPI001C9907C4|nr:TIR domain-containing protein [Morganella morganii]